MSGDNPDRFDHTVGEIVISKHAHKNVDGLPYASEVNLTHSSDLRTMEEIFHVSPLLGDAAISAPFLCAVGTAQEHEAKGQMVPRSGGDGLGDGLPD